MSKSLRISFPSILILTLILPVLADSPASKETESKLKVNVQVYNMAQVSITNLERAENEATRIFREAGIEMAWMECPCSQRLHPSSLMLRIIPQLFGSMRADFHKDNLGFAPTSEEGGVLATIFYHRIEALARGGDSSQVLGTAIAHELGHLLLGQNAHSNTGIMRPHWSRDDLKRASLVLRFTPEQAQLMRAHLAARIQQERLQPALMASLR